jgi:hypothetical protein
MLGDRENTDYGKKVVQSDELPWVSKPIEDDTPQYTYKETAAVNDFVAKIRTPHEFARGSNSDNQKYKTYKDYVKGMLEKYGNDLTDNDIATIAQKFGL